MLSVSSHPGLGAEKIHAELVANCIIRACFWTAASIAMAAALALLAKGDGKTALLPANSTSHWLRREQAGSFRGGDLAHSSVGTLRIMHQHCPWAVIFKNWLEGGP